jgi:hypothetical protein
VSDYIKLTNDLPEIYTIGQLRRDNPNVSFPRHVSTDTLASYGVYPYTVADQPGYEPATQVIEPGDFTETESGWVRGWTVRDKLPEEYAIQTAEQARKEIVRWIDGMSSQVLDLYPRAVQARWMIEEAAARAVLNGTDTDAQLELITREGEAKGRTPGEHAQAVVKNADRFRAITDQINTLFLATDAALAQATHPAQYLAIMARAKEQAEPLAEAYGLKV